MLRAEAHGHKHPVLVTTATSSTEHPFSRGASREPTFSTNGHHAMARSCRVTAADFLLRATAGALPSSFARVADLE